MMQLTKLTNLRQSGFVGLCLLMSCTALAQSGALPETTSGQDPLPCASLAQSGTLPETTSVQDPLPCTVLAQSGTRPETRSGQDPRRAGGAKITTDTTPPTNARENDDVEQLADRYQPKGITLGKFLLLPKIEFDQTYNDNVFATESDKKADFISIIRPEMSLRLREATYSWNTNVSIEANRYHKYKDDNNIQGRLVTDGLYEFNRSFEVSGSYIFSALAEERGSDEAVQGKEPTKVWVNDARVGSKMRQGRYTFAVDGGATKSAHDNVQATMGTIDNSDRDRTQYLVSGRASYEIFPGYAAVLAASVNQRDYDRTLDRGGYNRDSSGYRVEGGIGVELAQTVRGDLLIGYLSQDYKDKRFEDPAGLAFKASFNWTPSRLTLVVPTLERSVQETTMLNVSGMVRTSASVLVRHEYARNILLTGFAGVFHDEFKGINRDSLLYEARGRVTYAFDENVFVSGELAHRTKDSQLPGRNFNQNFIGLRLGLQM